MRKTIIAGNWKMNKNHKEAVELARDIVDRVADVADIDVVLCPPFTSLSAVHDVISDTPFSLGAQNLHWEKEGAFTGEISANMLLTLGCKYIILGHSERRLYFNETDDIVVVVDLRRAITIYFIYRNIVKTIAKPFYTIFPPNYGYKFEIEINQS